MLVNAGGFLSIWRTNLKNFSQLNKTHQTKPLNSGTHLLFQLKVFNHKMLVSNKSHVCTRSILRIQFSLLFWKQKYHKPVMAENFTQKYLSWENLKETKIFFKMRPNFKRLLMLKTTFIIKVIEKLELYLVIL